MNRRDALSALVALPLITRRAWAGEVPPDRQGTLILRSLAYDRNLKTRAAAAVSVLVLFRNGNQPSESMKTDMVGAFEELAKSVTVLGRPVNVSSHPFVDAASFEEKVRGVQAAVVYVCTGFDGSLAPISEVTRRRSALSVASSETYLAGGLSIAIVARGTKPTIALNLPASQAEGCEWDPMFLRLAEIAK
jgi:hypothetical protein